MFTRALIAAVAALLVSVPASAAPRPTWMGLVGIKIGTLRYEVEDRFGPGERSLVIDQGRLTRQSGCLLMSYPMPDDRGAVRVRYSSPVCDPAVEAAVVMAVTTRNRFAALPDGVRVGSDSPDPLKQARWKGYRGQDFDRGYGYHWVKMVRVPWSYGKTLLLKVELEVYAGAGRTGIRGIRIELVK